jgi:uncharacterized protein (DUF885 family)
MDENKKLDTLCKKFFDTIMKKDPVFASYLGLHQYDKKMPDESRKAYLEMVSIYERYLREFKKIKKEKLDFDRKINVELAIHNIEISLFYLKEVRRWEMNPDIVNSIGDAIFPLFARDFAPFEKRIECIIARLEKSSKVIEQAKTRYTKPVKIWTEMAIESCERTPQFFNEILKTSKGRISKKNYDRLEKSVNNTNKRIDDYKQYLKNKLLPKAQERFYIGDDNFEKLLKMRKLGLTSSQILALGEKYLHNLKIDLEKISNKINPGGTVEETSRMLHNTKYKTFPEILGAYKKSIKRSREFVIKNKIATVPKNEVLVVMETPVYMRHTIPFAAYFSPAKFDKKQLGIYIVTPSEQGDFRRFNDADIHNTSVHEGYPGHHLQLSCANTNKHIIRIFDHATEFVEGWAHYCEEYMREHGYDTSNEGLFIQTKDMIWRAARIIIDIKLSTGNMSFDGAVQFLMKEAGKDKVGAMAEIKRYTMSPGYQLSYLFGKHLIKELKNDMKKKHGKKLSDKLFHDTLLYSGSLPIYFHRKILEEKLK